MNFDMDAIIAKINAQIDLEQNYSPEKKENIKIIANELLRNIMHPMLKVLEQTGYFALDNIFQNTEVIQDIEALLQLLQKSHQAIVEKRAADEKAKPVIKVCTRKPKRVSIETSKIGKELRDPEHRADYYTRDDKGILRGHLVKTGQKKKGRYEVKPVESILMLEYNSEKLREKGINVPAFEYLSTFDLEVLTTCVTLLKEGNEYVSAEMIYHLMTGGSDKQLYPAMRKRIYDALRRLDCSRIYIDATQEAEAGYNTIRHYEGALLPNEFLYDVNISLNGKIIRDAIHFFRNSPLYDYSEAKKQVTSYPVEMLSVPGVNGTEQNILLVTYLARFIVEASNEKNDLKPIRHYSLIYEYLGVDAHNRTLTARIRATTRDILSEWVKKGYIKGFQELSENNTPPKSREKAVKIRIELFSKNNLQAITE